MVWNVVSGPNAYDHHILTQGGALALGGWLALSSPRSGVERILRYAAPAGLAGLLAFLASGLLSHTSRAEAAT